MNDECDGPLVSEAHQHFCIQWLCLRSKVLREENAMKERSRLQDRICMHVGRGLDDRALSSARRFNDIDWTQSMGRCYCLAIILTYYYLAHRDFRLRMCWIWRHLNRQPFFACGNCVYCGLGSAFTNPHALLQSGLDKHWDGFL